ncbi:dihydropteroate synthase, partial [Kaarinaea lacus]
VTPDSFSDGGQFVSVDSAMQQSRNMVADGAAIIDIGGESTRPGAKVVSIDEERQRVLPVIKRIQKELPDTIISIDTSKPEIMANAIVAGAHVVNDVNALRAPGAVDVIAGSNVAVCLMHMQGEPRTMQKDPHYNNVVEEVFYFLQQRVDACINAGIDKSRIIVDPGFGFGKNLEHNLLLFKQLKKFKELGVALLVGVSRKSMIGAILDKSVENRLIGSISLATLAAWMGADILRVHDVGATNDALKTVSAVRSV